MSMSSAYEIDDPVPPPRIDVGKMADALWEADYKLMSLIVDGALYDILFPIRSIRRSLRQPNRHRICSSGRCFPLR
jgi:hypothetical protein